MSTQGKDRRRSPIRRTAAAAAGVMTALAIAVPAAGASAATPRAVPSSATAGLAAVSQPCSDGQVPVAVGPTIIGSTFNGSLTIVVA